MRRANLFQVTSGNGRQSFRMTFSIMSIIAALMFGTSSCTAQRTVVSVQANYNDISNNLDLQAVASLFGETSNLEEFERRLNDYDNGISNLDLNNDGQIDYLRVVESMENNMHVIVLQAVLDRNVFQDVATINVERRDNYRTAVYIVGDPYIYGVNYVIEPRYIYTPPIFSAFWSYNYRCWYSPYSYGYYPRYYRYRRPLEINLYYSNIRRHVNRDHRYYYSPDYRRNDRCENIRRSISRSDYATRYPERTFTSRNTNISNRRDFDRSHGNNGVYEHSRSTNDSRYGTRTGTGTETRNTDTRRESDNNSNRRGVQDDIYSNRNSRSTENRGNDNNRNTSGYGRTTNSSSSQPAYQNNQPSRSTEQNNSYQRRESSSESSRQTTTSAPATRESSSRQPEVSRQPSAPSQPSTSNQSSRQTDSRSGAQSSGRR